MDKFTLEGAKSDYNNRKEKREAIKHKTMSLLFRNCSKCKFSKYRSATLYINVYPWLECEVKDDKYLKHRVLEAYCCKYYTD